MCFQIFTAISDDDLKPAEDAQPNISPVTDESQTLAHPYDGNEQPEPTDESKEPVQQPDGITTSLSDIYRTWIARTNLN